MLLLWLCGHNLLLLFSDATAVVAIAEDAVIVSAVSAVSAGYVIGVAVAV